MTTTLTIPRLNASGCPGPVAFEVLKPEQRTRFGYRPLAYICSPYSGDVEANVQLARRMCGVAVERHRIPIAPHLLLPQFMDDTDPAQRELAMFSTGSCCRSAKKCGYTPHASPRTCVKRSAGHATWEPPSPSLTTSLRRSCHDHFHPVHRH